MTLPNCDTLALQQEGFALHIWLNRPAVKNALSKQMVEELSAVFSAIADSREIRAVVLRGKDGNFCAGGDIKDMATARAQAAASGNDEVYAALNRAGGVLFQQIDQAPQVVIVALEGAVLGGGVGLACISDVAISLRSTQFGLPETSLGILPAQIAPFVVQRIGKPQARRLALLGMRFKGEEAQQLGIVHQVVDTVEALDAAVAQTLAQIKRCAPDANRATKALIHRVGTEPLTDLLDDAAKQFARTVSVGEGVEGTMAFVQKRAAKWAE